MFTACYALPTVHTRPLAGSSPPSGSIAAAHPHKQYRQPVDMKKSLDGLVAIFMHEMKMTLDGCYLFAFTGRQVDDHRRSWRGEILSQYFLIVA